MAHRRSRQLTSSREGRETENDNVEPTSLHSLDTTFPSHFLSAIARADRILVLLLLSQEEALTRS